MYQLQNELSHAVCDDNMELAVQVLNRGADINGLDANGETPLTLAVENRVDGRMLTFILSQGANVNQKARDGVSPLHIAVDSAVDAFIHEQEGFVDLTHIQILLAAAADPHLPDDAGRTPVDWARAYLPVSETIVAVLEGQVGLR